MTQPAMSCLGNTSLAKTADAVLALIGSGVKWKNQMGKNKIFLTKEPKLKYIYQLAETQ